jgi:hypothetical protein
MTTIKLKNGSGAPLAGDLVQGEPALDLTNKRLYTEDSGGTVIEVGTNPSTINIDAGTIDGTVIGGTTAAAITGTTITGTSFVSSGDMTFGDNDKVIFGAGSDLQIYHDGSNSFIDDQGTGSLVLQSNGAYTLIQNSSGVANARFDSAGAASLRYNGAEKLATTSTGINVTGTVTADDSVYVEGSSPRLQIQDTDGTLQYSFLQQSAGTTILRLRDNTSDGEFTVAGYGAGTTTTRFNIDTNGDISFYNSSGTSKSLFWDSSAESLGLGVSDPESVIHADKSGGGSLTLSDRSASSNGDKLGSIVTKTTSGTFYAGINFFYHDSDDGEIRFRTKVANTNTDVMTLVDGSVGIGTSSPSAKGHIAYTTAATANRTYGLVVNGDDSGTVGESSSIFLSGLNATTRGASIAAEIQSAGNDHDLIFATSASGATPAERMRIDSSGNVGIGKTPEATNSNYKSLEVGTFYVMGRSNDTDVYINSNAYYSDDWRYTTSNNAAQYILSNGEHIWRRATGSTIADGIVNNTGNWDESMRISSSGALLVNTTTTNYSPQMAVKKDSGGYVFESVRTGTGTEGHVVFVNANGAVGTITSTGTSTAYNTSSDQRLKDNIVDAPSASDDIDAIQVRSFDWKADGSHQKYGMVAQELQSVAPEAVSGDADSDDMMGVDYSKLVPMLVKEIQSLRARVAQLEGAN